MLLLLVFGLILCSTATIPGLGDANGNGAIRFRGTVSSVDKCFSDAYSALDATDCFTNLPTTNHGHARRLARCHHLAFNRSCSSTDIQPGDTAASCDDTPEFFSSLTAFSLHLDNLCHYYQSRQWHRTLALASAEARSTADALSSSLSTLASSTVSIAVGLDAASRGEALRAAFLRYSLWLGVSAAAAFVSRWVGFRVAAAATAAFIAESALVSFHGGANPAGLPLSGGWLARLPLPPLAAFFFRTLTVVERESAIFGVRALTARAAAAVVAAGAFRWAVRRGAALALPLPPRLRALLLRSEGGAEEGDDAAWDPGTLTVRPRSPYALRERRGAGEWSAWWRRGAGGGESAAAFALLLQLKAAASRAELRLAALEGSSASSGSSPSGSDSE